MLLAGFSLFLWACMPKRNVRLAALLLSLALLVPAWATRQQSKDTQSNSKAARQFKSGPVKAEGCLSSSGGGRFTLATSTDQLYLLAGDAAQFRRHNAQWVRITGTQSPPTVKERPMGVLKDPPPTLHVSSLVKLANTCGSGG